MTDFLEDIKLTFFLEFNKICGDRGGDVKIGRLRQMMKFAIFAKRKIYSALSKESAVKRTFVIRISGHAIRDRVHIF